MGEFINGSDKTLYVSCAAGIAGDMFLAALTDIADGGEYIKGELGKLPLSGYSVELFRDVRGGISGLRFSVTADETHAHRGLADIAEIILESGLSEKVKSETMRVFSLLAGAEAKVHGVRPEEIHFHEVGAVDSIIDLTGAMIMLDFLGWPEVVFSPLNVGGGTVKCAHGVLPVPAPAVAELLQGVSVYSEGEPMERVTPTGAALVKALGAVISPAMPRGRIEKTGTGLGSRDSLLPNALRAVLLEREGGGGRQERCAELSANIDDMTPQDLSAVMGSLFEAGALDVWFEPIQMKKNRPAVKLCCLAAMSMRYNLAETVLRETTTLGVRMQETERYVLDRRVDAFDTPLGEVRVKSAVSQGKVIKQMPEFDDILKLSKRHGMSVLAVRDILASLEFLPDMSGEAQAHAENEAPCRGQTEAPRAAHRHEGDHGFSRGYEHEHEHDHGHGHEHHKHEHKKFED